MADNSTSSIKSRDEFPDTPEGWARYWTIEMAAADKAMRKWHVGAEIILKEYLDERASEGGTPKRGAYESKLNFFWANIATMKAMLFGRMPEVDVTRRFGDADDDEARISGPIIMQRILNTDIEKGGDGYRAALRHCLLDFLLVGFGNAWVRYEASFEDKPAVVGPNGKAAPPMRAKKSEDAVIDYFYWKDQRWSPTRIWEDVRWVAKKVPMTKDQLVRRFGKVGKDVPLEEPSLRTNSSVADEARADPWDRAEVWEIWSKEHKKVFWWVKGFPEILDQKDDILKLKGFWPCPQPLFANLTNSALVPRPDYAMVQDLYRDINDLMSRIKALESALRVAGVFDRTIPELKGLLIDRAGENILIAVSNMAVLAEKGGLEAAISWLPLDQVVGALDKLTQKLDERRQILYELTGQNDLTHGSTDPGEGGPETATAQRGKIRYSGARTQAVMDEFSRFATELQQLRAEVIVNFFDPATIAKRSNVLNTPDAPDAMQAILKLKEEFPNYRIEVKSEAIAMQDFAAMKNDRSEFLGALSTMVRDAAPVAQMFPPLIPILLETIKWALAAFRGSSGIEGVFDRAIKQAQEALAQAQQGGEGGQGQQDPEAMKAQAKLQADLARIKATADADQQKAQLNVQTEIQKQAIQTQANIEEAEATARIKEQSRMREESMKTRAAMMRPPPLSRGSR